jgi:hypothetical protein
VLRYAAVNWENGLTQYTGALNFDGMRKGMIEKATPQRLYELTMPSKVTTYGRVVARYRAAFRKHCEYFIGHDKLDDREMEFLAGRVDGETVSGFLSYAYSQGGAVGSLVAMMIASSLIHTIGGQSNVHVDQAEGLCTRVTVSADGNACPGTYLSNIIARDANDATDLARDTSNRLGPRLDEDDASLVSKRWAEKSRWRKYMEEVSMAIRAEADSRALLLLPEFIVKSPCH